jgi:hypothetical protein
VERYSSGEEWNLQTIDPSLEFRVFVKDTQITAISQQHIHTVYPAFDDLERTQCILERIYDSFQTNIRPFITNTSSYVYDFALLPNDEPFFIEPSSFGKEYAAGSALFHWLLDETILYGHDPTRVYFRFTVA